jgi:hypothetical protein
MSSRSGGAPGDLAARHRATSGCRLAPPGASTQPLGEAQGDTWIGDDSGSGDLFERGAIVQTDEDRDRQDGSGRSTARPGASSRARRAIHRNLAATPSQDLRQIVAAQPHRRDDVQPVGRRRPRALSGAPRPITGT